MESEDQETTKTRNNGLISGSRWLLVQVISSVALALYGRVDCGDGTPLDKYIRVAALLELIDHSIEWIEKLGHDNFAKLVYDFVTEGAWLCPQGVRVVARVLKHTIVVRVYAPSSV